MAVPGDFYRPSTGSFSWPSTISSKLRWPPAQAKFHELVDALEPKVTRLAARDLVRGIRDFTADPDKIAKDSELKRLQ